jgi:DNA-binding GntR family transcriptional regulator
MQNTFPARHRTAREFVLENMRTAMVEGRLRPGQGLDYRELAEQMGVSRTPVREAIKILEVQGFVTQRPFSTPVVSQLSAEQIEDVYTIRKALEGIAAYDACLKIDAKGLQALKRLTTEEARAIERNDGPAWTRCNRRFHTRLYGASGKLFLCRYIDWLLDLSTFYMITAAQFLTERLKGSNLDHIEIIRACEHREPEVVRELVQNHLQKSATLLVEYAQTQQHPDQSHSRLKGGRAARWRP